MTDRQLLTLAAKAAGYWSTQFCCASDQPPVSWDPLVDDRDAMRLAVRLGIFLRNDFVKLLSQLMRNGMEHEEATRRAIVSIAAEIAAI